jgi:hypothetical protein
VFLALVSSREMGILSLVKCVEILVKYVGGTLAVRMFVNSVYRVECSGMEVVMIDHGEMRVY